jgi:hypothetical protein
MITKFIPGVQYFRLTQNMKHLCAIIKGKLTGDFLATVFYGSALNRAQIVGDSTKSEYGTLSFATLLIIVRRSCVETFKKFFVLLYTK